MQHSRWAYESGRPPGQGTQTIGLTQYFCKCTGGLFRGQNAKRLDYTEVTKLRCSLSPATPQITRGRSIHFPALPAPISLPIHRRVGGTRYTCRASELVVPTGMGPS